jgi:hypothetical protein
MSVGECVLVGPEDPARGPLVLLVCAVRGADSRELPQKLARGLAAAEFHDHLDGRGVPVPPGQPFLLRECFGPAGAGIPPTVWGLLAYLSTDRGQPTDEWGSGLAGG